MQYSVLIIDDEPAISVALMTRLEAAGYQVYHAINGLAGVEAAALHKPDLIILDIKMPDISGYETFERITRMSDLSEIPIIFLSAHAQDDARQRALDMGAAAFYSKPYNAPEIIQRISELLTVTQGEVGHSHA
ncbi:MAG: response regulator transcription factor [Phycisphaerales bacterium JB060]